MSSPECSEDTEVMRRHLIALDGKDQGAFAFNWYLENVYRPGDQVVLFHCSEFLLHVGLPGAAVNVELVSKKVVDAMKKAEDITQSANDVLKAKGIKGYVVLKSGMKPEEGILQAVVEEQVTHIIMGTRDLGTIQRHLAGSVSSAVATSAKVPVTIVKMPH